MGFVGSAVAYTLLHIPICCEEIDMIDIDKAKLRGEIADLKQAAEVMRKRITIEETEEPRESDLYIICAGKSSQDRESLLEANKEVVEPYLREISRVRKEGSILFMVTNPSAALSKIALDYMPYVFPIGNMLDNARLRLSQINSPHEKPEVQKKYLEVKEGKGYTNWAVASEVAELIVKIKHSGFLRS
jgi:malate/lactate dehydrogenase